MENRKTIKQYAAHAGVSAQSVYRRLQTEQNARALEGHIIRERGTTYLDDFAVQYLDGTRPAAVVGSPAAQQEQMVLELSDKLHKLREENDALKERIMDALQRLTAATQDAADSKVALTDAQARLRLLEAQSEATGELLQEHREQARQKAEEADRLREDLDQARNEIHQLRLDTVELSQLRNELQEAENEAEGFRDRYQEAKQESADAVRIQQEAEAAREEADRLRRAAEDARDAADQLRREAEARAEAEAAEVERLKSRGFWARILNR